MYEIENWSFLFNSAFTADQYEAKYKTFILFISELIWWKSVQNVAVHTSHTIMLLAQVLYLQLYTTMQILSEVWSYVFLQEYIKNVIFSSANAEFW